MISRSKNGSARNTSAGTEISQFAPLFPLDLEIILCLLEILKGRDRAKYSCPPAGFYRQEKLSCIASTRYYAGFQLKPALEGIWSQDYLSAFASPEQILMA